MSRTVMIRLLAGVLLLLLTLVLAPATTLAAPSESDIVLSAKHGSYQTGDTMSFSAAFSYDGAPQTPGSIEYRPVTWTITNMNIGTCQYAAANQGLALSASGNYTLLVTYNAYAYNGDTAAYDLLVGNSTVGASLTVTDSVIPNTIDVSEIGVSFLLMIIGFMGAIICLAFLRKRAYSK